MVSIYKKYLYLKYFYSFLKVSFIFFIMIIIMNLFEEIKFLKDSDNFILLPLSLTLLNSPSIFFEILPFVILISAIFFFIDLIDSNELVVYKTYGITNFKIIKIIVSLTLLIGIFMVTIFYNVSANFKFLYFEIKNEYAKDDKYLAVVTENGLWIRDKLNEKTSYINAEKLVDDTLLNISISQFDKTFVLEKLIISEKAFIKDKKWILKDVVVSNNNNSVKYDQFEFESNFDLKKILSIFENLSSLNIFKIKDLKKDYEFLGYNTRVIDGYTHKLYSYPIYLSLMVCLASILMLKIRYNKSKLFNITIGILISVLIYYINHFFKVIIETKDVPYIISIWGPQVVILTIVTINLVRINEK